MATRTEKALSIPVDGVPPLFTHAPTPNKPSAPILTLGTEDTQRFQLWAAARENGTQLGFEHQNVSVPLKAAMDDFNAYLITASYRAWAAVDLASREMQWRLMLVDVAEAANAKGTLPISQDPTGVGKPGPAVSEVGLLGTPTITVTTEPVTSGGPSPELVFGDDGDIVTTLIP